MLQSNLDCRFVRCGNTQFADFHFPCIYCIPVFQYRAQERISRRSCRIHQSLDTVYIIFCRQIFTVAPLQAVSQVEGIYQTIIRHFPVLRTVTSDLTLYVPGKSGTGMDRRRRTRNRVHKLRIKCRRFLTQRIGNSFKPFRVALIAGPSGHPAACHQRYRHGCRQKHC